MSAFYNENDPKAAAWLRQLIAEGHIARGVVDERSIKEIKPHELTEFTQCHFFAGIGGWSYALRLAGWPDSKPVWTGSCPCQPFSVAGQRKGEADERHLWPVFRDHIAQSEIADVFGEQVASADGRIWLDGISADLEGMGFAVGAQDWCAAGIGAPHIRQRLYWMAHSISRRRRAGASVIRSREAAAHAGNTIGPCGVGESFQSRLEGLTGDGQDGNQPGRDDQEPNGSTPSASGIGERMANTERHATESGRTSIESRSGIETIGERSSGESGRCGLPCRMEHAESNRRIERRAQSGGRGVAGGCGVGGVADSANLSGTEHGGESREWEAKGPEDRPISRGDSCGMANADHTEHHQRSRSWEQSVCDRDHQAGGWANYDIIPCADGKSRRIESGTFPLAHGVSGRVGLLRGYGNAIVPALAAEFIQAAVEALNDLS